MGKYSIHDDPNIDKQIQDRIERIVRKLVEEFPKIHSIILTGGFGKGEGSVAISDEIVKPLRDFDFIVIFERDVPKKEFKSFLKNLMCNESEMLYEYKYNKEFSVDIHATTIKNLNYYPDIVTYDLKRGQIVYGHDVRNDIIIEAHDIPLRSGARLLFQKSTALIGVMTYDRTKSGLKSSKERDTFIRETSKVYVEIGSALCILAKQYKSHANKRLQILSSIYREHFSKLYRNVPELVERIEFCTHHKLDPHSNPIREDPIKFWFQARNDIGEVMKFYFEEYLGLHFEEWLSYIESLESTLGRFYYIPLIRNLLDLKGIPYNKTILSFLNSIYNLKANFDQATSSNNKYHIRKVLLSKISLNIRFFCACLSLLFALNPDGTTKKEYVKKAQNLLSFVRLRNNSVSPWEEARLKCLVLMNSLDFL